MKKRRLPAGLLACLLVTLLLFSLSGCGGAEPKKDSLHIVMPAVEGINDTDTNYLRRWLEEQTGIGIELELISPEYTSEYLRLLFAAENPGVDIIFLGPGAGFSAAEISSYGAAGDILALEEWMDAPETQIGGVFKSFSDYDLRAVMTAPDGHIYYMPNLQTSGVFTSAQSLWMNTGWMQSAGAQIPATTEEFRQVLRAFAQNDPNGNGKADDIPAAGNTGLDGCNIIHYLMNAFTYTDPQNAYMAVEDGQVSFAPTTEGWREGLSYCRTLYKEGLLPELNLTFSRNQFTRLVNDPRNLVGAFAADSLTDILSPGSPELSSRFIHIPPLEGPQGVRYATASVSLPTPGGIIPASSRNPEAAFRLMDFMLSEDAYFVAAFGEEGKDWNYAEGGMIGYDGQEATVSIRGQEWGRLPNKNFSQAGPFVTYNEYGDRAAWSGYRADQRYLDARAARANQIYLPREHMTVLTLEPALEKTKGEILAYIWDWAAEFITGARDPRSNEDWAAYLKGLEALELEALVEAAQISYNQYEGE